MATLSPYATLDDKGDKLTDITVGLSAAVDLSNDFFNTGNELIVCLNSSAGVRTVTVKAQPDPFGRGGAGVGDVSIAIPAGKTGISSLLNPASYNSGGKVTFTLDATATTTIGILRLRKIR